MTLKRIFLTSVSVAGLMLLVPARGQAIPQETQTPDQSAKMKSVSGKVSSIASDKKSIMLEVTDGNDVRTMQFVVDQNTQVTGRVSTGSNATVQYQPTTNNQLLALVISPQDNGQQ